jgi:hypothetical protein
LEGGTAFALGGHNTVFSDDIVNGQVKLSDTNLALRLQCPAGTRYHEGTCIEKVARGPATWSAAYTDCRHEGRRLPTLAELLTFRLEPGITLGGEWTLQHDEDSATAATMTETGVFDAGADTNSFPYRCAARPKL